MNPFDSLISGTPVHGEDDVIGILTDTIDTFANTGHPFTPNTISMGSGLGILRDEKLRCLIEDIAEKYDFTPDNILRRYLGLEKRFTPLCQYNNLPQPLLPSDKLGYPCFIACLVQNYFVYGYDGIAIHKEMVKGVNVESISRAIGDNILEHKWHENTFSLTNNFWQLYISTNGVQIGEV